MAKDIAIYGAGGFGKEIACLIDHINNASSETKWNLIGFFDDGKPKGSDVSHYGSVLGGMAELNAWSFPLAITIAIGKPGTIRTIREKIINERITFPNIIAPNFKIVDEQTFEIGIGNIIQSGCIASCDVTIGNFNVFNGSDVMGHDVSIGDFNVVMPGVRISGEVSIDSGNMLGVNSVVLQQLSIGRCVTLAAGSVLMKKPKDNHLYIGVPAKIFKF